ncbi:MAG: pilus assembly protein [Propionibacteriaceae bacterium]|nr:pilus assembly protein [Propionibacteriaceae bacterium]
MRNRMDERGAAAVEVAVLIPVLLLVCIGAVAAWRLWWAGAQLQSATAAAARAAAQAATPEAGRSAAAAILSSDLHDAGLACANTDVLGASSQFSALSATVGQAGEVVVATSCSVALSDLVFPGLPASITVRSAATEAIDTYGKR